MNKDPLVTIITATYNSEKTLSETIESIIHQSYKNIEYIVIDGGSTDRTIEIIEQYTSTFGKKLKWISEKDEGIYEAWNKGLKLSSGEWICFIGSDDILIKKTIGTYVESIKNNSEVNFISSRSLQVKENLDPIRIIGEPWSKKMLTYNCIAHVGSLHHSSLFHEKGLFNTDYKISGDYDLLLRCYDIIIPIYIPIVTAKIREGGISRRQIFTVALETLKVKLRNKSRSKFICYTDYFIMIVKYYVRSILTNNIPILSFRDKNNIDK